MSYLEEVLAAQIGQSDLPQPVREYRFAPPRRWRFDFAWPGHKLAVEVEGGVHIGGRHTRPQGFRQDCEKYNEAVLLGWRVLRFVEGAVQDGTALSVLLQLFHGPATAGLAPGGLSLANHPVPNTNQPL